MELPSNAEGAVTPRPARMAVTLLCLLVGSLLTACTSALQMSSEPASSRITLIPDRDLNLDANGRPSPVPVRVYLLRNAEKLSRADYFQIVDHERDVLGTDLIARDEVVVRPGESHQVVL